MRRQRQLLEKPTMCVGVCVSVCVRVCMEVTVLCHLFTWLALFCCLDQAFIYPVCTADCAGHARIRVWLQYQEGIPL